MPHGGRVDVTTRATPDERTPDSVAIEIADTGVGIPESDLRKVFRPLFSTKARGAGLGLSFCRQAVEEHGGEIRLNSRGNGHGTVVVEPGAMFGGVVANFGTYDLIDFAHVTATGFNFAGGTLTILNSGTVVETLAVSGTVAASGLGLISDGAGGVAIGVLPLGPILIGTYYSPIQLGNPAVGYSVVLLAPGI